MRLVITYLPTSHDSPVHFCSDFSILKYCSISMKFGIHGLWVVLHRPIAQFFKILRSPQGVDPPPPPSSLISWILMACSEIWYVCHLTLYHEIYLVCFPKFVPLPCWSKGDGNPNLFSIFNDHVEIANVYPVRTSKLNSSIIFLYFTTLIFRLRNTVIC